MANIVHKDNVDIVLEGIHVGNTDVNVLEKAKLRYPLYGYNDSVLLAESIFNRKTYKVVSVEGGVRGVVTELKKHIEQDLIKRKTKKQVEDIIERLVKEQNLQN